ncbi:MAG: holo-ACP synthase [Planctomycetota bacterium]
MPVGQPIPAGPIRTGLDLVNVARLREKLQRRPEAREDFFAPAEIAYCERHDTPWPHYAARFAVKEALIKAFGLDLLMYDLPLIELVHGERGAPAVVIHCERLLADCRRVLGGRDFALSLSVTHEADVACAVVIVQATA